MSDKKLEIEINVDGNFKEQLKEASSSVSRLKAELAAITSTSPRQNFGSTSKLRGDPRYDNVEPTPSKAAQRNERNFQAAASSVPRMLLGPDSYSSNSQSSSYSTGSNAGSGGSESGDQKRKAREANQRQREEQIQSRSSSQED